MSFEKTYLNKTWFWYLEFTTRWENCILSIAYVLANTDERLIKKKTSNYSIINKNNI